MYETGKDMSAKYRETYHGSLGKIQPRKRGNSVKYNTMNNDEITSPVVVRSLKGDASVSFDDPAAALADRAHVGIAPPSSVSRRGSGLI